jgi:AcrR family transcriptional regulator
MTSTDTKTRILDAAERLFAADGFAAASVRAITREAGVNVAAIHYHFGSKEAVLRGVLNRVAAPITRRRMELLEQLEDPTVERLIEAFVRPDFEAMQTLHGRDRSAARFIGRIYSDPSQPVATIAYEQFHPTSVAFIEKLAEILPDVAEEELWWRLRQSVAVIVAGFTNYPVEGLTPKETEETISRLVAFLSPAIKSPARKE